MSLYRSVNTVRSNNNKNRTHCPSVLYISTCIYSITLLAIILLPCNRNEQKHILNVKEKPLISLHLPMIFACGLSLHLLRIHFPAFPFLFSICLWIYFLIKFYFYFYFYHPWSMNDDHDAQLFGCLDPFLH